MFLLEGLTHCVVVGDGRSQAKGSARTSQSKREAASRARESRPQDGGICTMLWTRYDATGIVQTEIFPFICPVKITVHPKWKIGQPSFQSHIIFFLLCNTNGYHWDDMKVWIKFFGLFGLNYLFDLSVMITSLLTESSDLYSNTSSPFQYASDVRTVQKRIQDIEESIVFINKEEALYKWDQTTYPEVDVIKESIEPYQKLFNLVLKWQRTRKRFVESYSSCPLL